LKKEAFQAIYLHTLQRQLYMGAFLLSDWLNHLLLFFQPLHAIGPKDKQAERQSDKQVENRNEHKLQSN